MNPLFLLIFFPNIALKSILLNISIKNLKGKNLKNSKEVEKSTAAYIASYNKNDEETRKHVQRFFMGEGCSYSIIQIMDYLISDKLEKN